MTVPVEDPRTQDARIDLPNIRQPNLKTRVHDVLLDLIIEGRYKTHEMLPPERILCEELGVSRTVVREAIKSLETRGVLKVIHGKGIQVVPTTSGEISSAFMLYLRRQQREVSLKDLMVVRYAIETEIARQAALHAEAEEIETLRGLLEQSARELEDKPAYIATDLDYHLHMSYATHNILLITILEALLIPLRRSLTAMGSVQDNAQSYGEHRDIFRCLEARDGDGAKGMMAKHLGHVENSLRERGKL
ncbi:MAG: FadR family transcriptional regulator [Spirochaetales bacterium]|nr:FadR family transcriptional regulator [Spirochaetales bacterium]